MPSSHDRQITIFSPEGKLYQIEYAIKAVSNAGILCLGFKGADTVCVVCPKKVSEKLMDKDCVTNLYKITPKIGALCVGSVPDCKVVVMQARQMAAKFKDANGYDMPVHFLAQKIGKKAQVGGSFFGAEIKRRRRWASLCLVRGRGGSFPVGFPRRLFSLCLFMRLPPSHCSWRRKAHKHK